MGKTFIKQFIILLLAVPLCFVSAHNLYKFNSVKKESIDALSLLSPKIMSTLALEFKGIMSDMLLLKCMTFLGERNIVREEIKIEEWQHVHALLQQIVELDVRFWDTYVVTEAMLVMQGGLIAEGNELLLRAAEVRDHDYRPYFLLWFNAYYLQNDLKAAAKYIALAAKRPNAPGYMTGITSRMNLYSGQIENGILFLEEMMRETSDPAFRAYLEKRLIAFKMIEYLEKKVRLYREKHGEGPASLQELVDKGLVERIPLDPYGGRFYIDDKGLVYTTSKLVPVKN